ncbi:MAG: hypothetical protein AVDCRST_MAG76-2527 [uncultured Acidimicrobiales bacterium]|uniref:D-alanyl-D-alanine carboxypeptidase-like core domain-containing protein n=1 Tax=uncultured Acidimicrobiales bacterium TaxID=310071 RepID=A0A6J4ILS3_9ACTN|nr:MAG: hypothetical protein AVDCRST_MAG76-2527 [uncultured Acidimicrobiales bacterium]
MHEPAAATRDLRLPDPTVAVPTVPTVPPRPNRPGPRRRWRAWWLVAALAGLLLGVVGWRALAGAGDQPGAWGGHENGRIPPAELCPLAGAPGHRLRCDAAAAYGRMAVAYRARFRTRLCITDSYRPFETQVVAQREKPALAAKPGTSNHGWALAVDLCGGANDFGTRQHRWLQANAPSFGWRQPAWARKGGDRPEPWHWEFGKL